MSSVGEPSRVHISLLRDMVDRARGLAPGPLEAVVVAALERGTDFLERADSGAVAAEGHLDPIVARAGYDILRHRALALVDRNERLSREVEALATESLALHEHLWQAHERSSHLKIALGRRRAVTLRPDAPLTIGGSGRRRPGPADRLLAKLERQQIDLELPPDRLERVATLAVRASWYEERFDDALLVVLAHGLAALEADGGPTDPPQTVALPPLESLARRVFELWESIRILEIRANAFRIDNGGMRLRLAQFEREIEQLEGEVAERGAAPNSKTDGLGSRLLGRLLRRHRGKQ